MHLSQSWGYEFEATCWFLNSWWEFQPEDLRDWATGTSVCESGEIKTLGRTEKENNCRRHHTRHRLGPCLFGELGDRWPARLPAGSVSLKRRIMRGLPHDVFAEANHRCTAAASLFDQFKQKQTKATNKLLFSLWCVRGLTHQPCNEAKLQSPINPDEMCYISWS